MSKDILYNMKSQGLINPPYYVLSNLCLLSFGGSISYGINTPESDIDLIGFYIPPHDHIYQPGIYSFDKPNVAESYVTHHVLYNGKSHDITIHPIAKLFSLAYDGNPSILDFLMSDRKYIVFANQTGLSVLDNANEFLSKKCVAKFLGFCTSEINNVQKGIDRFNNNPNDSTIPHFDLYSKYGFDVKAACNMMRLAASLDDLLDNGTYVPDTYKEKLKDIRSGKSEFIHLQVAINNWKNGIPEREEKSNLKLEPDRAKIRELLRESINIFYGE